MTHNTRQLFHSAPTRCRHRLPADFHQVGIVVAAGRTHPAAAPSHLREHRARRLQRLVDVFLHHPAHVADAEYLARQVALTTT